MIQTLTHNSVLWLAAWLWLYFQMFCFGFKEQLMSYCICVLCFTMNCVILYSLIFFWNTLSSLYNFPLLSSNISSYYLGPPSPLVHEPCSCGKGLEYFLICTFQKTTSISVGLFIYFLWLLH